MMEDNMVEIAVAVVSLISLLVGASDHEKLGGQRFKTARRVGKIFKKSST